MTRVLDKVRRAAAKAASASAGRDAAIREALVTHSVRQVAEAAGLSPARVHQIQHGK